MSMPSENNTVASSGQRKLVAIMFTDMKGFSEKMGKDETATMRMLKTHNKMMGEVVLRHGGSVIKTIGDAFFVSFESVVTAVRCAVEAQEAFHEYNRARQSNEQIIVRIGVHVGDIVMEANDVFGDGVNIAARIQPLASPGGICVSEDVVRQMRGKFDLPLIKLGRGELKNIKLPVVIYKVDLPWEKARLASLQHLQFVLKQRHTKKILAASIIAIAICGWLVSETPLFKPRYSTGNLTIAVLPFVNVGDPSDDYFSDGITEDIISRLESGSGLFVISEASSFFYKGKNKADRAIAQELGVRFLVKGSLQTQSTRVKIHNELVDIQSDRLVWSENFEIARSEFYQAGERILERITQALGLGSDVIKAHKKEIPPQVYESYLKGLYSARQLKRDANALAIEYFQETIRIDSTFVPALVALADAQTARYEKGWDQSPEVLSEAEMHCKNALRLEPTNATVYAVLGIVEMRKGNQLKALEYFNKAHTLDPHDPFALTDLAEIYLTRLNDAAKAITYLKTLQEIQPTSPEVNSNLGIGYAQLKNYPEAIQAFRKAIQFNPEYAEAWSNLGYSFERIARYDSAIESYGKAIGLNPLNPPWYVDLASVLLSMRRYAAAESVLLSGIGYLQGSHELLYALGVTYAKEGKQSAANRSYQDGLTLLEVKLRKNSLFALNHAFAGLFYARLGKAAQAESEAQQAIRIDSSDDEVVIRVARIYSLLKKKDKMLYWFGCAKAMNPEYDAPYVATDMDFDLYRTEPDLLLVARQE